MSIARDIDVIISLVPVRKEPTSAELAAVRKRLRREPARTLREMRSVLESLAPEPSHKPNAWDAAVARSRELPVELLQEWSAVNEWAKQALFTLRATV